MAQKRMFSFDVIGQDNFIEMPLSSQALYFHLGITHWHTNNLVREDREAPTQFLVEAQALNTDGSGKYSLQKLSRSTPAQIRLGKVRLDEINNISSSNKKGEVTKALDELKKKRPWIKQANGSSK